MFLKRLELQGFKTFNNRTEFEFGSGVTAIIGPNGSGKSNVADAVRWVLGEQSGRLIRTKRAEDVIFAGSSLRSPAGLAEVVLTFDNSSGWMPIDFSEVTLSRRVYRDGDSEYLINRGKVRLRDVVDLLAKAGMGHNTYTVIGQGMVDSALSLRSDERRGLIEEAADIRRYHTRIAEAEGKLEATLQNLARARDITSEIGPRLGRLEKQASQATEHVRLTKELATNLATWYYQSWQKAAEAVVGAREVATRCQLDLARKQEELSNLAICIDETRQLRAERRIEVGAWQKEQATVAGKLDRVSRQLAVDRERAAFLLQQRREMAAEIDSLSASVSAEVAANAGAEERLAALCRDSEQEKVQLGLVLAELDAQNRSQAGLQAQLSRLQEQARGAAAALSDVQNRLAQLNERDNKLTNEVRRLEAEDDRLEKAAGVKLDVVEELGSQLATCEQDLNALGAEREARNTAMREVRGRIRSLEGHLSETQRERARLQSQFDTLSRLHDSFSGLYTGVRTVLQAASLAESAPRQRDSSPRVPSLTGVVGIVATLINVPQHLEAAVEVALGGHLQDVVVEKWAHAEEAIELLKMTKGGRATFLPLDTVRGGRLASAPDVPGVIGAASELVGYDDRLRNVVRQLLGQTVVVKDLAVARDLLRRDQQGAGRGDRPVSPPSRQPGGAASGQGVAPIGQIVTLAGEIVRSSGSITGGATRQQADGAMLARERELRDLPEQIRVVALRQSEMENGIEAEWTLERRMAGEVAEAEKKERRLSAERQRLEGELARSQRESDRLRQEAEWQKNLGRQVEAERAEIEGRRKELVVKLAEAEKISQSALANIASLQREAEDLLGARAGVQERINELRTRLAVMERAMESERALMVDHEARRRRTQAQKEAKGERLESLTVEGSQLESEVEFLEREKADLEAQIEALMACIEPAEARLAEMDAEENQLRDTEAGLRSQVLEAERKLVQANLAVQRCGEDLAMLRERMDSEGVELPVEAALAIDNPELATHPWQLSLAIRGAASGTVADTSDGTGSMVQVLTGGNNGDRGKTDRDDNGHLPEQATGQIAVDPAALKRRIDRLRSQLRSIGPVNPTAVEEYEEAKSRYEFLDGQIRDLTESEKSLREVIALLETEARKQFDTVFETVAREFKQFFSQLFGGGTAKLIKSEEGDGGIGGVDVIAQPPGKRLQNLASLSGGERALTATALLFAILKVNPAPFCMLDEVDAALDEANVNRFIAALRQLSERTQFIVISHNRGTVETSDTLYGISMGADGISRVVSLRIQDRPEAGEHQT